VNGCREIRPKRQRRVRVINRSVFRDSDKTTVKSKLVPETHPYFGTRSGVPKTHTFSQSRSRRDDRSEKSLPECGVNRTFLGVEFKSRRLDLKSEQFVAGTCGELFLF
jgi:hypothetical protein